MKKIANIIFCAMAGLGAFTACGGAENEKIIAERDSLLNVNAHQRKTLDEITSTIVEVSNILDTINVQERILFSPYDIEGRRYTRKQFVENIRIFENVLHENRIRINQLDSMLNKKDQRINKLSYMVRYLYTELDKKDSIIKKLKADVRYKNVNIKMLKNEILSINENMTQLEDSLSKKSSDLEVVIEKQEQEIHTVYYIVDTKKNLIEKGVLSPRKLFKKSTVNYTSLDTAHKDDRRKLKRIEINGSKPTVLSNMPETSYKMVKCSDERYKLEILDMEQFWSMSKLLVVQIK